MGPQLTLTHAPVLSRVPVGDSRTLDVFKRLSAVLGAVATPMELDPAAMPSPAMCVYNAHHRVFVYFDGVGRDSINSICVHHGQ